MKTIQRLVCLSVLLALGGGVVTPPASAQDKPLVAVKIGVVTGLITEAPLFLAKKLGYFKDEGIDAQFTDFDSATTMVAPLGVGQLDVAGGALTGGLYNVSARGIDVKVVADLGSDPKGYGFQQLIVRTDLIKSGKFKSAKDMKGWTIPVSSPGTTASPLIARYLATGGLKFDDVKKIYLPLPDQVLALQNGSADATWMPEPTATTAVRTGVLTKVMGDDQIYLNQQISVLMFGKNILANHALGVSFMRAFLKGARYYNDALKDGHYAGPNGDMVVTTLTENTRIKDPAVYRAVTPNGLNPNGHLNFASMRSDLDFYKAEKISEPGTSVDTISDDSFVTEALKTLPPYKPAPR
jgi:NitT/TauT family transport system substrate-binding protein